MRADLLGLMIFALAIAAPNPVRADDDPSYDGYFYSQIGATFGMVDDSFVGDYEDTIGLNGRIGLRYKYTGFEIHVEGLPDSIVKRSKNSKKIGEDIVSVTFNVKFFHDIGPFETYAVAGIGVVSLTEVLLLALDDPDDEFDDYDEEHDEESGFHARVGLGVQFPVSRHLYGFVEGTWNGGGDEIERYSYVSLTTGIGFRF